MHFLVVGASGFLGSHLRRHLAEHGHAVLGTRTRPDASTGLLRFDLEHDRLGDVVPAAFFAAPTWVVICSCVTPMDRCRTEPERSWKVNVENTIRLADDATARGARVAFVSSSYVFSGEHGYYAEDHPHGATSAYGQHKSVVDQYLTRHHPDALVVRLDKIMGSDPAEQHPFSDWWNGVRHGRPIVCIRDQILSPTCVDDISRGIRIACELGLRGAYHLANNEFFSREELARQFLRGMNCPGTVISKPLEEFALADARPMKPYLDSTRFRLATGLRFTSMRTLIERFRTLALAAQDRVAPAA